MGAIEAAAAAAELEVILCALLLHLCRKNLETTFVLLLEFTNLLGRNCPVVVLHIARTTRVLISEIRPFRPPSGPDETGVTQSILGSRDVL